jgi:hypothetical protein
MPPPWAAAPQQQAPQLPGSFTFPASAAPPVPVEEEDAPYDPEAEDYT